MHIATSKKTKAAPSNRPNKSSTQQEKHPLMPIENNDALQKWHMTNTPPKIDKYDTHREWWLTKMAHLAKKYPKLSAEGWAEWFLKVNSQIFSVIQTNGYGILKSSFSSLCLILGVGSISRVLVVLQKTNNVSFEMSVL